MARHRSKRLAKRRKVRKAKASYGHGLKDAIAKWFPGQCFSHGSVLGGSKWTPLRLFWMALLMVWSAEQTLPARFDASRDVLRALFPKWSLGTQPTPVGTRPS